MAPVCRARWLFLVVLLLAGCGSLPHPFEHDAPNALLEDRKAMRAVVVVPVAEAPGLDKALVNALADEDIAASSVPGGDEFYELRGEVSGAEVIWRLHDADGTPLAEHHQTLPPGTMDAAQQGRLARKVAADLAQDLRGLDSGQSDIDMRPRVSVRAVKAPAAINGPALGRAMANALAGRGITVTDNQASSVVEGTLRVTSRPGPDDLVEMVWQVLDAKGTPLATVAQSSPVPRQILSGNLGQTGRDIAEAGAGSLAVIVRQIAARRQDAP